MCACTDMQIHTGLFKWSDLHFWRLIETSYQKETHFKQEVKKAFQTQPTSNRSVSIGYTDLVPKLKCPWGNRPFHEIQLFYSMS